MSLKKFISESGSKGLPGGPNEMKFSVEGYKSTSPDRNNPHNIINSGNITMKGVPHPVFGQDNLGNGQMMYPGQDYQFPGNQVFETPIKDDYEDVELTEEEIQAYRDGGYVVEELPEYQGNSGSSEVLSTIAYGQGTGAQEELIESYRHRWEGTPPQQVLPPDDITDASSYKTHLADDVKNKSEVFTDSKGNTTELNNVQRWRFGLPAADTKSDASKAREVKRDELTAEMKAAGFEGYNAREVLKEGSDAAKAWKEFNKPKTSEKLPSTITPPTIQQSVNPERTNYSFSDQHSSRSAEKRDYFYTDEYGIKKRITKEKYLEGIKPLQNGGYVVDELSEAQDGLTLPKTKIDYPAINEFFTNYINTPEYKARLEGQEYENPDETIKDRLAAIEKSSVEEVDIEDDLIRTIRNEGVSMKPRSEWTDEEVEGYKKAMAKYKMRGSHTNSAEGKIQMDFGQGFGDEEMPSIYAHELGHNIGGAFNFDYNTNKHQPRSINIEDHKILSEKNKAWQEAPWNYEEYGIPNTPVTPYNLDTRDSLLQGYFSETDRLGPEKLSGANFNRKTNQWESNSEAFPKDILDELRITYKEQMDSAKVLEEYIKALTPKMKSKMVRGKDKTYNALTDRFNTALDKFSNTKAKYNEIDIVNEDKHVPTAGTKEGEIHDIGSTEAYSDLQGLRYWGNKKLGFNPEDKMTPEMWGKFKEEYKKELEEGKSNLMMERMIQRYGEDGKNVIEIMNTVADTGPQDTRGLQRAQDGTVVDDCPDGRCHETDQVQNILDKRADLVKQGLDKSWNVIDAVSDDDRLDASKFWKEQGLPKTLQQYLPSTASPSTCSYSAASGLLCVPEAAEKIPVNSTFSNYKMRKGAKEGTTPFSVIDETKDPSFLTKEGSSLSPGDFVSLEGVDKYDVPLSHMQQFSHWREDDTPIFLDSNGEKESMRWHEGMKRPPSKDIKATIMRYMHDPKKIAELEEKARTNPTYIDNVVTRQDGGEHEDMYLTEDQIAEYRAGGYVVEEYQEGGEKEFDANYDASGNWIGKDTMPAEFKGYIDIYNAPLEYEAPPEKKVYGDLGYDPNATYIRTAEGKSKQVYKDSDEYKDYLAHPERAKTQMVRMPDGSTKNLDIYSDEYKQYYENKQLALTARDWTPGRDFKETGATGEETDVLSPQYEFPALETLIVDSADKADDPDMFPYWHTLTPSERKDLLEGRGDILHRDYLKRKAMYAPGEWMAEGKELMMQSTVYPVLGALQGIGQTFSLPGAAVAETIAALKGEPYNYKNILPSGTLGESTQRTGADILLSEDAPWYEKLGVDLLTDPLTYFGAGAATKGLKATKFATPQSILKKSLFSNKKLGTVLDRWGVKSADELAKFISKEKKALPGPSISNSENAERQLIKDRLMAKYAGSANKPSVVSDELKAGSPQFKDLYNKRVASDFDIPNPLAKAILSANPDDMGRAVGESISPVGPLGQGEFNFTGGAGKAWMDTAKILAEIGEQPLLTQSRNFPTKKESVLWDIMRKHWDPETKNVDVSSLVKELQAVGMTPDEGLKLTLKRLMDEFSGKPGVYGKFEDLLAKTESSMPGGLVSSEKTNALKDLLKESPDAMLLPSSPRVKLLQDKYQKLLKMKEEGFGGTDAALKKVEEQMAAIPKDPSELKKLTENPFTGRDAFKNVKLNFDPEIAKNIKSSDYLERYQAINKLKQEGLLSPTLDSKLIARHPNLTETVVNKSIKDYYTSFRGVNPDAAKLDVTDWENMFKQGLDYKNPDDIAKYMATTIPRQQFGDRAASIIPPPSQDLLFTSKSLEDAQMYGDIVHKVRPDLDLTGNYADKLNKYIGANQFVDVDALEKIRRESFENRLVEPNLQEGLIAAKPMTKANVLPYVGSPGKTILNAIGKPVTDINASRNLNDVKNMANSSFAELTSLDDVLNLPEDHFLFKNGVGKEWQEKIFNKMGEEKYLERLNSKLVEGRKDLLNYPDSGIPSTDFPQIQEGKQWAIDFINSNEWAQRIKAANPGLSESQIANVKKDALLRMPSNQQTTIRSAESAASPHGGQFSISHDGITQKPSVSFRTNPLTEDNPLALKSLSGHEFGHSQSSGNKIMGENWHKALEDSGDMMTPSDMMAKSFPGEFEKYTGLSEEQRARSIPTYMFAKESGLLENGKFTENTYNTMKKMQDADFSSVPSDFSSISTHYNKESAINYMNKVYSEDPKLSDLQYTEDILEAPSKTKRPSPSDYEYGVRNASYQDDVLNYQEQLVGRKKPSYDDIDYDKLDKQFEGFNSQDYNKVLEKEKRNIAIEIEDFEIDFISKERPKLLANNERVTKKLDEYVTRVQSSEGRQRLKTQILEAPEGTSVYETVASNMADLPAGTTAAQYNKYQDELLDYMADYYIEEIKKIKAMGSKSRNFITEGLGSDNKSAWTDSEELYVGEGTFAGEVDKVIEHEIAHVFGLFNRKLNKVATGIDDALSKLDLLMKPEEANKIIKSGEYFSMSDKNKRFVRSTSYFKGRGENYNSFEEATPFLAEARQALLDGDIIKDIYQPISKDMIKNLYKSNKLGELPYKDHGLRILDIIQPTEKNFDILTKNINKLLGLTVPVAIGAGVAAQESEPTNKKMDWQNSVGKYKQQDGGVIEMDLNPKERAWYRSRGYVVEEM